MGFIVLWLNGIGIIESELINDFFDSTTACNLSKSVRTYLAFWDGMDLYPLHTTSW